ncbi:hypothetical protein M569_01044 [Genlisea aurea]|uniref:Amine oxidase domain-containing protein n=1 Tax=Genlisea aurea TaxID=192259 RepID=S8D8B3_9LAMI|nr:hypothetical protein M569_01044 [Genlisea aurea]
MELEYGNDALSGESFNGIYATLLERQLNATPTVIVVGGGISGLAAARTLQKASFKVILLESQDRIGGRIQTDYTFGCPVDMGASWLHGVCHENPLSPIICHLGLTLYRTSGDDSVLYDHDLESYALFDINGNQVSQNTVIEVGVTFKKILEETDKIRKEQSIDISVKEAMTTVLDRNPDLRLEGLSYEVLQWYICRMEAWFAADTDKISLKAWDEEKVLSGGHGLMIQGYDPVIKALSTDLDIRLNHRVKKILQGYKKVVMELDDGREFTADAAIVTVPLGVLKANGIEFEPKLPEWKLSAISDLGMGNENKIALRFDHVFWPNVEYLGVVSTAPHSCGYFLNLHKATKNPVLVYMAAGKLAYDLEKLSDGEAADFAMAQLRKMFPDAREPAQYLVSHWGTDPNVLGCYSYDAVGNSDDIYDRIRDPLGNVFFGGEAASVEHQGSVHGAYSAGVMAAESCRRHLMMQMSSSDEWMLPLAACRDEAVEISTVSLQISRL